MASPQGNRIALEDVLDGRLPNRGRDLVQDYLGENRSPYYTRTFEPGGDWALIQGEGYEVLVLAGGTVQQMGGLPAYIRFGMQGPANEQDTDTTGAVPVLPGTCIPVPQGFKRLWFKPSADIQWTVVICRAPHTHINYGPYAHTQPPPQYIDSDGAFFMGAGLPSAEPMLVADGIEIPSRTAQMSVRIAVREIVGTELIPRRLGATEYGPLEIWWGHLPTAVMAGSDYVTNEQIMWVRNKHEDWTANELGIASESHDIEKYSAVGYSRIYVRDTTGWTNLSATATVSVVTVFHG